MRKNWPRWKTVLERMEAGGQPIEEALKDYEAGLKLIAGMEKELAGMKQRMTVLGEKISPRRKHDVRNPGTDGQRAFVCLRE